MFSRSGSSVISSSDVECPPKHFVRAVVVPSRCASVERLAARGTRILASGHARAIPRDGSGTLHVQARRCGDGTLTLFDSGCATGCARSLTRHPFMWIFGPYARPYGNHAHQRIRTSSPGHRSRRTP